MVRAVLKSYRKNILREMKDNLSRMVSVSYTHLTLPTIA